MKGYEINSQISSLTGKFFFSIIIPSFNSALTIRDSVDSILNQTFGDFEILIVDSVSQDKTTDIIREFTDQRIRLFVEKDNGIYDAMNKGIKLARGEWIYFLGSDDRFYDGEVLQRVSNSIQDYDVVYGDVYSTRFNGLYDGEFSDEKIYSTNICHQSIFFRRNVFEKTGPFDLLYKSHADWDHNLKWFFDPGIKKKYISLTIAEYADGGFSSKNPDSRFVLDKPEKFLHKAGKRISKSLKLKLLLAVAIRRKEQRRYLSFLLYKLRFWFLKYA